MVALCSSTKCTNQAHRPMSVEKFNITRYKMDCPDCGSILFWCKSSQLEDRRKIFRKNKKINNQSLFG